MKYSDKFFLVIIIGALILVGVTLIVVLNQPEPEYRSDDSPASVVHNYLLALKKTDYQRAKDYLADCLESKPANGDELLRQITNERWYFEQIQQDSALSVQDAIVSDNRATVRVIQRFFYNNGLFNSREYSDEFNVRLILTQDGWKIVLGDRYWLPDLWKSGNCP